MPLTGNKASISFAGGFTAYFTMISGNEESVSVINTEHLGTTNYVTKMFGDLTDPGELEVEFHFNPTDIPPRPGSSSGSTVVTFPPPAGQVNGATFSFNGGISKWKWGDLKNNEIVTATATVTLLGAPTWSDAPSGTYA